MNATPLLAHPESGTAQTRLSVSRYRSDCKVEWDRFVDAGKNATFMFRRDYMDYHADRFEDHSLVIRKDGQIVGLLPANLRDESTLVSHQGLTYGGFVLRRDATLASAIEVAHGALAYLYDRGILSLIYKRIPRFYNTLPDDEIDYILFLLGARLTRRDCTLTICSSDRLPLRRGKKSNINKASRVGLVMAEQDSFKPFWCDVLGPRLWERFRVKPVHTLEEISQLAARLPQHIKQFSAYAGDSIVAGVTVYETPTVAHMQYIAATSLGDGLCALDFLFDRLIRERYKDKMYFDFGICNEEEGRALNHGLLQFKEGFGARSFAHDFYLVDTGEHRKLDRVSPAAPMSDQA